MKVSEEGKSWERGELSTGELEEEVGKLQRVQEETLEQIAEKEKHIDEIIKALKNRRESSQVLVPGSWCSISHLKDKCEATEKAFARHKFARGQLQKEITNTAHHIRVLVRQLTQLAADIKSTRQKDEKAMEKRGFLYHSREKWYEEELPSLGSDGREDWYEVMDEPEPVSMDDSSFNVLMWRYRQRAKMLMLNKTLRSPTPSWLREMKEVLRNQPIIRPETPTSLAGRQGMKNDMLSYSATSQGERKVSKKSSNSSIKNRINDLKKPRSVHVKVRTKSHANLAPIAGTKTPMPIHSDSDYGAQRPRPNRPMLSMESLPTASKHKGGEGARASPRGHLPQLYSQYRDQDK